MHSLCIARKLWLDKKQEQESSGNTGEAPAKDDNIQSVASFNMPKATKRLEEMRADLEKLKEKYGVKRVKDEIGNWITPCLCKDHYKDLRPLIDKYKPTPIDEPAKQALEDNNYKKGMIKHGKDLAEQIDPIWEKEYINPE